MNKLWLLVLLFCSSVYGAEGPVVDPPKGCIEARLRGVNCLAELNTIFAKVDKDFQWTSDLQAWGKGEYWATARDSRNNRNKEGKIIGDCDDFAILIREELDKRGIESRLVFAITDRGGAHLVVSVGDYILDSKLDMVVERKSLPYRWISQSGLKPGDPWHQIL